MVRIRFFDCGPFDDAFWRIIIELAIKGIERYGSKIMNLIKQNPYFTLYVSFGAIALGWGLYVQVAGVEFFLNLLQIQYTYMQDLAAQGAPYETFWLNLYTNVGFHPDSSLWSLWSSSLLSATILSLYISGAGLVEIALKFRTNFQR